MKSLPRLLYAAAHSPRVLRRNKGKRWLLSGSRKGDIMKTPTIRQSTKRLLALSLFGILVFASSPPAGAAPSPLGAVSINTTDGLGGSSAYNSSSTASIDTSLSSLNGLAGIHGIVFGGNTPLITLTGTPTSFRYDTGCKGNCDSIAVEAKSHGYGTGYTEEGTVYVTGASAVSGTTQYN